MYISRWVLYYNYFSLNYICLYPTLVAQTKNNYKTKTYNIEKHIILMLLI